MQGRWAPPRVRAQPTAPTLPRCLPSSPRRGGGAGPAPCSQRHAGAPTLPAQVPGGGRQGQAVQARRARLQVRLLPRAQAAQLWPACAQCGGSPLRPRPSPLLHGARSCCPGAARRPRRRTRRGALAAAPGAAPSPPPAGTSPTAAAPLPFPPPRSCNEFDGCCTEFEACVSCCMSDTNKPGDKMGKPARWAGGSKGACPGCETRGSSRGTDAAVMQHVERRPGPCAGAAAGVSERMRRPGASAGAPARHGRRPAGRGRATAPPPPPAPARPPAFAGPRAASRTGCGPARSTTAAACAARTARAHRTRTRT
jgi:hypothetical protein